MCVGVDSAARVWGWEDRWRRLMSVGIGRIVRHLMNERKLATLELTPATRLKVLPSA